jgi:hypothetical protein
MTSPSAAGTSMETNSSFIVHAVPIGAYQSTGMPDPFPEVAADDEAHAIANLLAPYGGVPSVWDTTTTRRGRDWVGERLSAWAERSQPGSTVLVWIGHGETNGTEAWLASFGTRKQRIETGHGPEELARHVQSEWTTRCQDAGAWTLVVIEACGAETFVNHLVHEVSGEPNPAECIAFVAAGGKGTSFLGRVPKELRAVLDSFTDNDDAIDIHDLVGRLERRLGPNSLKSLGLGSARPLKRPRTFSQGITAPQDIYLELKKFVADLPADQRAHFLPKAQGAEQGELAWYFVGRADERRQIAHWLASHGGGLLVVTGPAGSGKSALLGNILVHTTPKLRDLLIERREVAPLPTQEQPPDNVFDAVILLTGMSTPELVERLVDAAGFEPQAAGLEISARIEQLLAELEARTEPFTVLADALDESQDPLAVAGAVIRRVAAVPGCRVVVGTRRSTNEGPDIPERDDTNLLDALGGTDRFAAVVVGLDTVAVTTYVQRRLRAALAALAVWAGDLGINDAAVSAVAQSIGAKNRQFLYARLAVHEILARPELLTATRREELTELLARDHRALFAAAVQRLASKESIFDPLLEALAFTQGRGLPRADHIWATVASALADDHPVTETDLDNVLTAAAPYIMLDAEDGQSVYRLAHRTFQEYFLTRPELGDGRRRWRNAIGSGHR